MGFTSHVWMSRVRVCNVRMYVFVYRCQRDLKTWLLRVMWDSRHTYARVTWRMWMRHITHMHESRAGVLHMCVHRCRRNLSVCVCACVCVVITYEWVRCVAVYMCRNHIWMSEVCCRVFIAAKGISECVAVPGIARRGGGLGSSTIFKKFNEPYAPS